MKKEGTCKSDQPLLENFDMKLLELMCALIKPVINQVINKWFTFFISTSDVSGTHKIPLLGLS